KVNGLKEFVAREVEKTLSGFDYQVAIYSNMKSCFDIAARQGKFLLLIKVLGNVDSLREDQSNELKKLASVISTTDHTHINGGSNSTVEPIIVGVRTKDNMLEDNTIYERYDIPTMNLTTFKSILENGSIPSNFSFRGRVYSEIDSKKLSEERAKKGYSMQELSDLIGISKESIYRNESGKQMISNPILKKLEKILESPLQLEFNLFSNEKDKSKTYHDNFENKQNQSTQSLSNMGFDVIHLKKAPFDAYAKCKTPLIFSEANKKHALARKSTLMRTSADFFNSNAMFISDCKNQSIGGIAVINNEELSDIKKIRELIKLIKEKEVVE
ncbi:MAG: helix-turn-helix domain-containing protein, partial [Candidatus Diapherotrites archaeon]|nr:helix-turn-helix domain-containing protein [Candidatus Diapherotrites archaeon]